MSSIRLDSSHTVKNVIGSSLANLPSSKKYWISKSGKNWPCRCSVIGCGEVPSAGSHVKIGY